MKRIDTLHLHNFKFFDEQEPIKLDGKHLLLYGENGSGKSSIYWGLYTLFEASEKPEAEIKKYFKKSSDSPESLVNIYAEPVILSDGTEHYNSFVKVETSPGPTENYQVSLLGTSINTDATAKEINLASDFLSYKVLYKFQDFWNGETIDLANIFIGYILPYLNFSKFEILRDTGLIEKNNAYEMWQEIKKGPGTFDNNGKVVQVYKTSEQYRQFTWFSNHFSSEMQSLIDFINANAPQILKDIGYDIEFHLVYTSHITKKGRTKYDVTPFKIELKITKYLGREEEIRRPQSFLNEAKMTALALAIRLAVLKKRINSEVPDLLKFIVLDDVMISLDMNNRDKLIDYLLNKENKYSTDYQLLFLTHDRGFFNFLMDKIRNTGLKNEFVYKEMYVDSSLQMEKPTIYDYPNKLNKAEYYLQVHDYPACGIYLRKKCEEILSRLYPDPAKYTIVTNSDGLYESSLQNLNNLISHLEYFCETEGLDYDEFRDLKIYKSVILNSLAHNDVNSPLYKVELEKVLQVLKELEKIKRDVVIKPAGKSFKIHFTKTDGTSYKIGIQTKDALKLIEKPDGCKVMSNFCKATLNYIDDNGVETHDLNIEKESITQIVEEKCVELGISMIDIPANCFYRNTEKLEDIIASL